MLAPTEVKLLESVKHKSRYLSMGRTPVKAIEMCWKLQEEGYLEDHESWISLTEKGRQYLAEFVVKEDEF